MKCDKRLGLKKYVQKSSDILDENGTKLIESLLKEIKETAESSNLNLTLCPANEDVAIDPKSPIELQSTPNSVEPSSKVFESTPEGKTFSADTSGNKSQQKVLIVGHKK